MKIVGISACPAGLAHTPMAAKALMQAGIDLGYDVKIEQQGILGIVNRIEEHDLVDADLVLIASDQKIEGMERFKGKKVVRINIQTCIKSPQAVLKKCVQLLEQGHENTHQ